MHDEIDRRQNGLNTLPFYQRIPAQLGEAIGITDVPLTGLKNEFARQDDYRRDLRAKLENVAQVTPGVYELVKYDYFYSPTRGLDVSRLTFAVEVDGKKYYVQTY